MTNPDAAALAHINELIQKAPWILHPANSDQVISGCSPLTYGDLVALLALPVAPSSDGMRDVLQDAREWLIAFTEVHPEPADATYIAQTVARIDRALALPADDL